ncbi:MAG: hypothetical protein IPI44_18105, partial [Sulfuritalea sp.]|nr:hypothetical protein [Sulfuritalea sp.]
QHWFHPAASLVVPKFDLTGPHAAHLSPVAEAFTSNVTRLQETAAAPIMAVAYSRNQQQLLDEACLEIFGDLAEYSPDDARAPAFQESVRRRWEQWLAQNADPELFGERVFLATGQLDQLQDIDATVKRGLESMLRGIVVGAWTTFEVLASDLWETAVNLFPHPLARLSGVSPAKTKRRLAAFTDEGMTSPAQGKSIRMDYLQAHGYDLSSRMGTVLRERFNFQVVDGIRDAYYSAFEDEPSKVRSLIASDELSALATVRNLLVHRSGSVDQRFLDEHARNSILQHLFPSPILRDLLPMSGLTVHNLVQPTIQLGTNLIVAVDLCAPP